jgi:ABC-type glycerol-3-phosphate transport system permease component
MTMAQAEIYRSPAATRINLARTLRRALFYAIVAAGALIMIVPLLYMLSTSFTPHAFVLQTPPVFIPSHPTLDNYITAWQGNNFGQAFLNSAIVASSATALNLALGSMLAFAFARYAFPGRNILFYGMLATMTVPSLVLIIPQFVLASHLHLTNSRLGLILIYAANMSFTMYLLRSYFEDVPQDLFDAAAIDGCGVFRSFWNVAIPLARPALAAATIFTFAGNWDEFTLALTLNNDQSLYTLPVAIQQFYSNHGTDWGIVFAATTIAMVPIVTIFLIFQRHFVSGIAAGALKA